VLIEQPGTIAAALRQGRDRLARTVTETPRLDAEVLLRSVLGLDRTALFTRLQDPLDPNVLQSYFDLIERRGDGVPVAYLTGEREFMGLSFRVGPGVLVPRPETEILVEWALAWLRDRAGATVVDVGTGSGAIALSLARLMGPDWTGEIIGADVSAAALRSAQLNQDELGLKQRASLVQGSLLDWLCGPVDLILANLPYLRPDQIDDNPDVAAEPRLALEGGNDGLALIRQLLTDAPRVLGPGGAMGLEIDPSQTDEVRRLVAEVLPASRTSVLRDLAGFERHVTVLTEGSCSAC
jgi:release factor glutamine methyltransferase